MTSFDRMLLNHAQSGLELCPEPYRALADKLGTTEETVLERLRELKDRGIIRRLGGIFNSGRLGYVSCLVGAKVDPARIDTVASFINGFPGVTHNYERSQEYNLWFTLSASSQAVFDHIVGLIQSRAGVQDLRLLPANRVFQSAVTFTL